MGATCTKFITKKKTASQGNQTDRRDVNKVDETPVVIKKKSAEDREAERK